MLSRSSLSECCSLKFSAIKKLVGGNWCSSPTITVPSPRDIAATASHVGIWDASSKMTRSNCGQSGPRYCETESGLISIAGHILEIRSGMVSNNLRIETPRQPFRMHFCRKPTSELWDASFRRAGSIAESLMTSSRRVVSSNSLHSLRNRFILSSNNIDWKKLNSLSCEI